MNAVAIMTPLPKNFAMINAIFGIFKAGILFANIGKKAPTKSASIDKSALYKRQGEKEE